ncbi:MAG: GNAT family N-acetyltransferase [Candidatus Hodarchaeales archaeon]|jgi:RimJ/RimL family protein N-acetyltransferase
MPIEGEKIILREEKLSDLELLLELRNDLDTQAWSKSLPPDFTEPMVRKRFEEREFSFDRTDGKFIIEERETNAPVGYISYTGVEPRFSASIGITISKKFWGGGYAYESQELLLKFLFQELGLRVVRLWTHSGNPRAVKLAERSGFKLSGKTRESIFKDGKLLDNLMMDILREEYYSLHPELKDTLPDPEI